MASITYFREFRDANLLRLWPSLGVDLLGSEDFREEELRCAWLLFPELPIEAFFDTYFPWSDLLEAKEKDSDSDGSSESDEAEEATSTFPLALTWS